MQDAATSSQQFPRRQATAVRARAPLRLALAGGGTDLSPFCDVYGGCILNATIDMYAYTTIERTNTGRVRLCATDQNVSRECAAAPQVPLDGQLDLHSGVYNRIVQQFNDGVPLSVNVTTFSDALPGSGLGSSSTLVVSMVKGFAELLNLPLGEYEIAHLAYQIERIDVGLGGGKQDQYAAAFGGFNFMEFYANDRVIVNPLRIKEWILSELESSLVLYYSGVSRSSAAIIEEQVRNIREENDVAIDAMKGMKEEAIRVKEYLLTGNLRGLADSLDAGWEQKKRSARGISNELLESLYERARSAGALCGKVSGAGGGGFMMFLADPARRMDVVRALSAEGSGQVVNCHFTPHGSQGWRIA